MAQIIEVDLVKTRGRLVPPEAMADLPAATPPPSPASASVSPAAPQDASADGSPDQPAALPKFRYPEPSRDDALEFTQTVLWKNTRFAKTYSLFGGAGEVRFHTLTIKEEATYSARADTELIDAINTAKFNVVEQALINERHQGWRLAWSTESLTRGGQPILFEAPADVDARVLELKDHCGHMTVYSAVCSAFTEFSHLVAALGERAPHPSFWPATGPAGATLKRA